MLEDRDYMRSPEYGASRWRSVTVTLLLVNFAVFASQVILAMALSREGLFAAIGKPVSAMDYYFGLSFDGLRHGYLWQLLTFQFLHGGLLHIALNSFGIFTFGLAVEQFLGAKRFLKLYLISGVIGGLIQILVEFTLTMITHNDYRLYIPVVGASAGLFGLIAAFATMFPERDLTVLLFFVLPITVSARVLLAVSAGISVLGVLIDKSNVAHAAHAGGMLGGWLMLRYFARRPVYATRKSREPSGAPAELETDFLSKDVDPILDKISRQGIQSLTAAERKILDAARKKMERR